MKPRRVAQGGIGKCPIQKCFELLVDAHCKLQKRYTSGLHVICSKFNVRAVKTPLGRKFQ
jgi:hypothetical protein